MSTGFFLKAHEYIKIIVSSWLEKKLLILCLTFYTLMVQSGQLTHFIDYLMLLMQCKVVYQTDSTRKQLTFIFDSFHDKGKLIMLMNGSENITGREQ